MRETGACLPARGLLRPRSDLRAVHENSEIGITTAGVATPRDLAGLVKPAC